MSANDSKGIYKAKYAELFSGIPPGKTLIDVEHLDELLEDTKRVGVINWDTAFDQILKNLLCHLHFPREDETVEQLFEPSIGGPLASLTHKAKLAYALGLINKTYLNDLLHLHNIRNRFAHSVEMTFANTKVRNECKQLSTAKNHKVTATNSYTFYRSALRKCIQCLNKALKQETYRQAALNKDKEKSMKKV